MIKLEAWQHIYTNVEKEQSPTGAEGFQTVFYSHSALSEEEVERMEARLLYIPSAMEPIKRVFFTTSEGKCVAAQIVPLPEPDRLGRGGRYLAHSLVFAPQDFVRIGANPFVVFRHFMFITSVEEALRQGDFRTGDIPPVAIEVPDKPEHSVEAASLWSRKDWLRLTLLALRARQLAAERIAVAFVGEPEQVESAVEAALWAVPPALRLHCTFDTYFYRCNLVATYYWGVGLMEAATHPSALLVDTRSRQVVGDLDMEPKNAYERWLMKTADTADLSAIGCHRDIAFALSEWLDGRAYEEGLVASAPTQVVVSVFGANPEQVRTRLYTRLGEHLPSALVQRAGERICRESSARQLFQQLRAGFATAQLLRTLHDAYASQGYRAPQRDELQALGELLQRADHRMLRLVHACWMGQRQIVRSLLEGLSENEYRQFAQTAIRFRIIEALHLIVPGRGEAFIDLYLSTSVSQPRNWASLVKALLDAGEAGCLERLLPCIQEWSPREVKGVARLLRERSDVPEEFQHAVNEALAVVSHPKGLKALMNSLFRRSGIRESRSKESKHPENQ